MDRHRKRELQHRSLGRLRNEIAAERAAALTRITRTLERHCAHARDLWVEIRDNDDEPSSERCAAYEAARRQAGTYLWYLRVQREVNGLFDGDTLEERYAIPAPLEQLPR